MELARLKHMRNTDKYINQHYQLLQRAPVDFQHDHGYLCNQFLHKIKDHIYCWMNLSQCGLIKRCYCKMCPAEDKSNSLHNYRPNDKGYTQQGAKHKGKTALTTAIRKTAAESAGPRSITAPCNSVPLKP